MVLLSLGLAIIYLEAMIRKTGKDSAPPSVEILFTE